MHCTEKTMQKDKVNKDILAKMKEAFMRADQDGSGRLAPEEFVRAFQGK